jgi:hypothetical protein
MPNETLERMRLLAFELEHYGESGVGTASGVFGIRYKGVRLRIIASSSSGWEHVSVSLHNRCPTWDEMDFVKGLFWTEDETAMQLHPPQSEWINNMPYCLHLWRPTDQAIPRPPSIFVGKQELGDLTKT